MDSPEDGTSSRLMRLKVLYTFDLESKNNCLARWPNPIDVRTAFLDETTQIGVVDLKTCIQTITSSSPELISKLDNDYTIYAYDYSEPDTPLVGQGLLSWALAANPQDSDMEGCALVTGRVTRNGLGLFARNAQETLEVKLRLTPVPSSTQNDYLVSLKKYKEASGVIGQDFDAQAWNSFLQNNPGFMSANVRGQSSDRSASPLDRTGLESVQRMLTEGTTPRDLSSGLADPFTVRSGSRPPSRSATPMMSQQFNPPSRQQGSHSSRPSSRSGMQSVSHQRRDSFNSGYYSAEETFEEGPAKKRAKTTRVEWPSRSDLNIEKQPDSLRVVASTASSVRLHRPVAVNPALALQTGNLTEEPVRPPTPIPKSANPVNRRQKTTSSSLRRGSQVMPSSPTADMGRMNSVSAVPFAPSPDEGRPVSASSTPAHIPSSPPMMPDFGVSPSSPVLPPLPNADDSGFMSGTFEDLFDDAGTMAFDAFINEKGGEDVHMMPTGPIVGMEEFPPVFDERNEMEEPTQFNLQPPPPVPSKPAGRRAVSRTQSSRPASRVSMSSPKLAPAPQARAPQNDDETRSFSQLPQIPASDPVGRSLHRSNTWAGDMSDMVMSDALMTDDPKPRSKKKVGKEQTKARLEAAIAAGDMPPFCDNCGAIETPAWRRAFAKTFECDFDEVETSLDEGACVFKEVLEHNDDGSVKRFRGFKITKKPEDRDDEWVCVTLCNPCGLWFHKQKCMRPPEKWNKGPKDPKDKRKRRSRPRGRAPSKKASDGNNSKSDAGSPASDASSPQDTATEAPELEGEPDENDGASGDNGATTEPELPPMPKRAASAEPVTRKVRFGLKGSQKSKGPERAVQSSPLRVTGSDAQPIEIDLTPKPIRRQLFSPPKDNQLGPSPKSRLGNPGMPLSNLPNFVRRSPRLNKTKEFSNFSTIFDEEVGKENVTPSRHLNDGLDHLFNDADDEIQLPPMTPTPTRRSDRLIFKTPSKTPTRTPGATLSPNVRRSLQKSVRHPALAALVGNNKNVADMTPFTKQIHELLSDAATHQVQSSPPGPPNSYLQRTPKKNSSPKNNSEFDFPDLPSLHNSSPMSHGNHITFDFSELTTEQLHTDFPDLPSTDAPMPSSPPPGFFNFIDTHDDGTNEIWNEIDFGTGSLMFDEPDYSNALTIAPAVVGGGDTGGGIGVQGVRRSPRKKS